jgi:hypothetical protein
MVEVAYTKESNAVLNLKNVAMCVDLSDRCKDLLLFHLVWRILTARWLFPQAFVESV